MSKLNLLPKDMKARSLSDSEIVLSYKDALKALDIFDHADLAFLGWEGWAKYHDGTVGHCDYQGTESIDRKPDEPWKSYAKRGYDFVKKTITDDYKDWEKSEHAKKYELYFCISVISEEELSTLQA
jgi:hypothetical protein